MIQLSGMPFQQLNLWQSGSIEDAIVTQMHAAPVVYSFYSLDELRFELGLRKNIIRSARAMYESKAQFTIFEYARCNPQYWDVTREGGFQIRPDVRPADAIRDIYRTSTQYAFECATACVIIFYHAVLNSIGMNLFNQLFQNLYLYSWHSDPDLRVHTFYANQYLPGDVVYFNNPDFTPNNHWFRGINAVVLNDGKFFGHGFGIRTPKQMISILNEKRIPKSTTTAYLTNLVTRTNIHHLANYFNFQRNEYATKIQPPVIHHNKSSISFQRYLHYLYEELNNWNYPPQLP